MSWLADGLEDQCWDLVGEDLVALRRDGPVVAFEFSAATLIATADTEVDPWVLQLPGGLVVGGME
ncbi:MAG: hypothetical protein HGA44_03115 [Cellulomonadaceae bacterium]|nr:hypothetical protein [Cellulomonadaceae bacterium]